ncbi:hypothetical protein K435DRAFT_810948 [Dendrothele bispora CBS 962.96]|uniref:Uncharacterized protein n=1 Tax=Dendrothele bispora (strain CBS 962.96) TaxID=1314807 RepID=A0A4S8KTI6_DENBC|nr:hypothetical protein K435DRAFT_810948 [Dendrothele bispora CBS 962.96]
MYILFASWIREVFLSYYNGQLEKGLYWRDKNKQKSEDAWWTGGTSRARKCREMQSGNRNSSRYWYPFSAGISNTGLANVIGRRVMPWTCIEAKGHMGTSAAALVTKWHKCLRASYNGICPKGSSLDQGFNPSTTHWYRPWTGLVSWPLLKRARKPILSAGARFGGDSGIHVT